MRDVFTGRDLDAADVTQTDGSVVERPRVALGHPTEGAFLAVVNPDGSLLATMDQTEVLQQLRRIARLLEILTGETVSLDDIT